MKLHKTFLFICVSYVTDNVLGIEKSSHHFHRFPRGSSSDLSSDSDLQEIDFRNGVDEIRQVREGFDEEVKSLDAKMEDKFNKQLGKKMTEFGEKYEKLFVAMNEENNIPLRRLSYTSKYLWDQQNFTLRSYKELKYKCDHYKLTIPEVRNEADFQTIVNFLMVNPKVVVGLGLNDNLEEGIFLEGDGETKIEYQRFAIGEPDNAQGKQNCVIIGIVQDEVSMKDVPCENMNANLICQRKIDSFGYEDSVEHASMEPEGLTMIGDAGSRRYFVSHMQRVWKDAKRYCEDGGKQLLDLELNEANNQGIFMSLAWQRRIKGLTSQVGFWTSGKFENGTSDRSFTWQSNLNKFELQGNKVIRWEWLPGEPADQGGKGLERCLDFLLPSSPSENGGFTPQFRVSNCHLPFYFLCYEDIQIDESCKENGPMKYIGLHSKFVYDTSNVLGVRETAKDLCEKWDYQLAEVESIADISQIGAFLKSNGYQNRIWHLGISDKDLEGEFYEESGTPIVFNAFNLTQPDNKGNEDCVVLLFDKNNLVMDDRDCSTQQGHVLCQFQKDSSCFMNSAENVRKPVEDVMYFGETAVRRYFLSKTQKTWLQAMQFCSARKTKLLDLTFIGELKNPKNAMFFVPKMVNWARLYRTGIWTSGRYLRSVEDGQFRWETTLEMFKNDDKSINFTWAPGEPSDSTKRRLEICIELVLEPWASSKAGDAMLPMLKAANCKLPNYFVCYEDAPHTKNCHVPPKIDYGFKALRETERFIYVDIPQKMDAEHREDICKGVGLELAEISSVQDYKTVSKALDEWNATSLYFGLGLNSVGSEGLWSEGNGKSPIRFQAFGPNQPLYYHYYEPLDHVVFNKHKSPVWQMTAISAKADTNVLCQFNRESTCSFASIFNYIQNNEPKDYLVKLKFSDNASQDGNMSYHIADSQTTWEEAMRFCWSRRMKLLDLKVDRNQAQIIYHLLTSWLERVGLDASVVRFWTSGKYVESYADRQFRWETFWTFVRHQDLQKDLNLVVQPPPISTSNKDRCVTIGLEGISPRKGEYKANLKTSNCFIPQFVVCVENDHPNRHEPPPSVPTTSSLARQNIAKITNKETISICKRPKKESEQIAQAQILKWIKTHRPPTRLNCEPQPATEG